MSLYGTKYLKCNGMITLSFKGLEWLSLIDGLIDWSIDWLTDWVVDWLIDCLERVVSGKCVRQLKTKKRQRHADNLVTTATQTTPSLARKQ